jgi:hypothetical protein
MRATPLSGGSPVRGFLCKRAQNLGVFVSLVDDPWLAFSGEPGDLRRYSALKRHRPVNASGEESSNDEQDETQKSIKAAFNRDGGGMLVEL